MLNAKFYPLFTQTFHAIDALLAEWQDDALHIRLLQTPLATLKQDFMSDKVFPALLGPLLAYRALREPDAKFTALAAAHILFYAFLDLTDDVEDHDLNTGIWHYLDDSLAINAGTSLLFLAYLALDKLKVHKVKDKTRLELQQQFSQAGWALTVGQHQDLYSREQTLLTPEACIKTIQLKSGTSVGLYFGSAACLAGAKPALYKQFQQLGMYLGTLMQLRSDYTNIMDNQISSDLRNRQFTLPLALAYEALNTQDRETFDVSLLRCRQDRAAHTILRHLIQKTDCKQRINAYVAEYQSKIQTLLTELKQQRCQTDDLVSFADRLTPL